MALVLHESTRQSIAHQLQPLLTHLLDLNLHLKQVHWNIRGTGFRSLHLHLDEILETTGASADELAERIVALDFPADGRAATIANGSGLTELAPGFMKVQAGLMALLNSFDQTIALGREAQVALGELDPVSEDLTIGVLAGLEKQRWMLAAELDNE